MMNEAKRRLKKKSGQSQKKHTVSGVPGDFGQLLRQGTVVVLEKPLGASTWARHQTVSKTSPL